MQALQQQVGKRIKALREARGLSQEALAGICNLHRTYVGLIERGERNLSLSTIEVLARGLGVAPSELFSGTEVPIAATARRKSPAHSGVDDVRAHIATLKQLLIEAKLTDARRYDTLFKANTKKTRHGPS
jgi:transcriptional regulator with XRE-family HTH domain